MNTKMFLVALLVASLAGNAAFLITTFSKRSPRRAETLDKLELTADQSRRFHPSKVAFQKERAEAHREMKQLRSVLADEIAKAKPDRQRLVGAGLGMVQVQTRMRPKLIDHLLALHSLLTPTQRSTLAELLRTGAGGASGCPGAMLDSPPAGMR